MKKLSVFSFFALAAVALQAQSGLADGNGATAARDTVAQGSSVAQTVPPAEGASGAPPAVPPTVVQGSASGGVVGQTGTGAGGTAQGSFRVTQTSESGESHGVSGNVSITGGASQPGASQLPNAHVEARHFWGNETPAPGERSGVNVFVGGAFDRNTSLGRLWDGRAFVGWGAMATQPTSYGSRSLLLSAQGELGAGGTGSIPVIPYLQVRANAAYEECLRVNRSSDRHQLCASVAASVSLGLVQVGLDVSAGGEYRYRIEDGNGTARAVLFVGPNASASTLVDLNGAHGGGAIGLSGGVRFQ